MTYDLKEKYKERVADMHARYYVQGETVRSEPRRYWVVDREDNHRTVSQSTTDRRQAVRWMAKLESYIR